jgi:hypothetical protein
MRRSLYKLLAVALALTTAGAQVVCACPTAATIHELTRPITRACVGEGDCCVKVQPIKAPVSKQEPCGKCNLKNRTQQAMPEPQPVTAVPQLDLSAFAAPVAIPATANISIAQLSCLDRIQQPPLLTDLFHVHSLLLI